MPRSKSKVSCCCIEANTKVAPFTDFIDDISYRILEIQPNRFICIHYFNPCPRDKEFEQHMKKLLTENRDGAIYREEVLPKYIKVKSDNQINVAAKQSSSYSSNSITPGVLSPTELTMVSEDSFHQNKTSLNHTNLSSNSKESCEFKPLPDCSSNIKHQNNTNLSSNSKESCEFKPLPDCSSNIKHQNKVIFFIHGVGGSVDVFRGQSKHFSNKGYELIIPEWIGHGMCPSSKKPEDYYFDEILKDLTLVFDLHCKRTNIIVGHSYGCCFAAALARTRPRLVSKLMMISGGAPTPLAPQPGLFQAPTCLLICCNPVLRGCFLQKAFYKKSKTTIAKTKAFDVPTNIVKNTMNGQRWPEGGAAYHRGINCPTYLVHGAEDQLIPIEDELEMKDTIFFSDIFIIEKASHMVMMEKPESVNCLIENLIADDPIDCTDPEPSNNTENAPQRQGSQVSVKSQTNIQDDKEDTFNNITPRINNVPSKGGNTSKNSTPKHGANNSPSRINRSDLKSAKSIPGRLFSAKRR